MRRCEGELGETGWACDSFAPVPSEVFETFDPLPGTPDPSNPTRYRQIEGQPAFDEDSGERNSNPAVFVLTEGIVFCMLVESDGEAALFDVPEGEGCVQVTLAARRNVVRRGEPYIYLSGRRVRYDITCIVYERQFDYQ